MKNKFTKYLIILLVTLNVVCIYFLVRPHRRPHQPPKITNVIEFDASTKSKIDKLEQGHFEQIETYNKKIKYLRRLVYINKSQNSDYVHLDSVFADMANNQREIEKLRYQYFITIKSLCTQEQRKEIDLFIKRMLEHESMRGPKGK